MKQIIELIRPWQWVKNLFVFLPMFFGRGLTNPDCWTQAIIAFFAISFIASSIYCFNDILDIEENQKHPVKKNRPLASGVLSITSASVTMAIMALIGFSIAYWGLNPMIRVVGLSVISIYFLINILYCTILKHFSIIDVMCIAFGFVLRVVLGGTVCGIWLSPWIICMTFLLTLMLAFAKRRDDVCLNSEIDSTIRDNTKSYNLNYLNQVLGLLGGITIVCYIIYTVQPDVQTRFDSSYVYITSVFVVAGILRYLKLSIVDNSNGGNPTDILLRDRFLQLCIVFWVLTFVGILYL